MTNIPVPHTAVDFLKVHHPGWWASITELDVKAGHPIAFIDTLSLEIIMTGKVDKIIPPGEVYLDPKFLGWWKIVYTETWRS